MSEKRNFLRGIESNIDSIAHSWLSLFDESMWDQQLNVLDVGCGSGKHAAWWNSRRPKDPKDEFAPYTECAGIDINDIDSEYKTFEFVKGDYHKLPWPRHTFDIVWSHYSLQYSTNPARALWEWRRVLKPDGRLYLTVPSHDYTNRSSVYHRLDHYYGSFFTVSSLLYMLALNGYNTSQAHFYKSKNEPFIRVDVPVNNKIKMPLDNLETNLYNLVEQKLLPPHLEELVIRTGELKEEDFIITWVTGLIRDFRSDY